MTGNWNTLDCGIILTIMNGRKRIFATIQLNAIKLLYSAAIIRLRNIGLIISIYASFRIHASRRCGCVENA